MSSSALMRTLLSVAFCASFAVGAESDIEARIDRLLATMTIEEKAGQLTQYSAAFDITGPQPAAGVDRQRFEDLKAGRIGSVLNVVGSDATRAMQQVAVEETRLGIPLIFGYDVIHGYQTMFPIPLAEAASWDVEAMERSARLAAIEASAAGIHWTFAPVVDLSRDARWGRVMEGAGEDPYLSSLIAAARVRGFQGADLTSVDTVAACAKHLAAYGFVEAGREYNTVDVSEHTLHNVILPPFKAASDAGVATVMSAFNEVSGIPATASYQLQTALLKQQWGFDGFVVSDWGTIGELVEHGVAKDNRHAAHLALNAGNDMDMEAFAYRDHLAELLREGLVSSERVDDAVRRVLRVKFRLGLFDDPYQYADPDRERRLIGHPDHLAFARELARKSIVLLKNNGSLPLADDQRIAVIGPLANDRDTPLGSWRAQAVPDSAVSLLDGVMAAVSDRAEVTHATGVTLAIGDRSFVRELTLNQSDRSGINEAVKVAAEADVVLLALGEDAFQSGEGRSQVDIGLKGLQNELIDAVLEANERVVVVLMSGRPLAIGELAERVPAIIQTWHLGSQAGHAIADVIFGKFNPSGRLPVSFPHHVGQMPLYYNHKPTGRGDPIDMVFWSHYTDAPNTPLYPFGHGLSYTTFDYSKPSLDPSSITAGDKAVVSVTIRNTGDHAGTETVQLYVRDRTASVTRPVRELKGFKQVYLEAGQSRDVVFELTQADLAFYTARGAWEAEPGAFDVMIGRHALDVQSVELVLEP